MVINMAMQPTVCATQRQRAIPFSAGSSDRARSYNFRGKRPPAGRKKKNDVLLYRNGSCLMIYLLYYGSCPFLPNKAMKAKKAIEGIIEKIFSSPIFCLRWYLRLASHVPSDECVLYVHRLHRTFKTTNDS